MDIHFIDLSEDRLPPDEVRIRDFKVEPYSDGRRVRVTLQLTPFQKRPSGEIVITNALGERVAEASIVETMEVTSEYTLHLRTPDRSGTFTARVIVFYSQPIEEITEGNQIIAMPERSVVDEAETEFEM